MAKRTCTDAEGCDRAAEARGLCMKHWKRIHGKRTKYLIECVTCGRDWLSDRRDGKYCSDSCKGLGYRKSKAVERAEGGACMLPPEHSVMRLSRITPPVRAMSFLNIIVSGPCAWCGTTFTALTAGGNARYCSHACMRSANQRNYKQFWISKKSRLEIYERDGWVCQLCMEPVDRSLVGSHENWAPSLDHIACQSWSANPDHSPSNLRLAHRWCNAVRGDERWHADFFTPAA